jgi:microcystin degradation protein MlrC
MSLRAKERNPCTLEQLSHPPHTARPFTAVAQTLLHASASRARTMSPPRIFTASLGTEVNTFAPIPTDRSAFENTFYAPPGEHPDTPTLCSAPIVVLRRRAAEEGFDLVEGTAAWAEPAGIVSKDAFEGLRDEILGQLEAALAAGPIDAVILGMHGAMVAQGYDDPEGDLLSRVRAMVGDDCFVSSELDPHSHLTDLRFNSADLLISFKEFSHVDFVERAEELVELSLRAVRGEIKPVMTKFDCKMIEVLPTSRQPMRDFVDKMMTLEHRSELRCEHAARQKQQRLFPAAGCHFRMRHDHLPRHAQNKRSEN